MKLREKVLWSVVATFLIALFLYCIPATPQICDRPDKDGKQHCASYRVPSFLFVEASDALNDYGAAISAVATVAIAVFTYYLKTSTDRLWDAGERQTKLARRATIINAAGVRAARKSADVAEKALTGLERPYLVAGSVQFDLVYVKPTEFKVTIKYGAENLGRTPATITSVGIKTFVDNNIEDGINKIDFFNQPGLRHIAAGKEKALTDFVHPRPVLAAIFNSEETTERFFFVLEIRYSDFEEKNYLYGFACRAATSRGKLGVTTKGCEKYNFHRKL